MNKPTVKPFTKSELVTQINIANQKYPKEKIEEDYLFRYLFKYLDYEFERDGIKDELRARFFVVEEEYVSESFLEDHKYYYSTCFEEHSRFTTRIHFFGCKYGCNEGGLQDYFINNGLLAFDKETHSKIWNSYKGYITVRPLASTFFGTCLLEPYHTIENYRDRQYNSTLSKFRFDVFGKKVQDFQSLGFQQQDSAVGACATFSVWVCLHKLSEVFKIKMLSPYEITKSAGRSYISSELRVFPTRGLVLIK